MRRYQNGPKGICKNIITEPTKYNLVILNDT